MLKSVVAYAPAKINPVLRVLDRRSDGYHNLWSLMHTVGVEDELYFTLNPESSSIRLTCDDPALPTDGRNLIVRAAGLVLEQAALHVGLDIRVVKRIPVSAGLGGGSSDAAATLLALNRMLTLHWSTDTLASLGARLGSDVPFFFSAPAAVVRGRGDVVAPITVSDRRWVVLVNPGFPIETRWAYDRLAATRPAVPSLDPALKALELHMSTSWDSLVPLMQNDFEAALAITHPALAEIKRTLQSSGADGALLSGSGATVFGVFRREEDAWHARDAIKRTHGWWTAAAPACTEGLSCQETAYAEH